MFIFSHSSLFHCGFMIKIMLKEHSVAVIARLKEITVSWPCVSRHNEREVEGTRNEEDEHDAKR